MVLNCYKVLVNIGREEELKNFKNGKWDLCLVDGNLMFLWYVC